MQQKDFSNKVILTRGRIDDFKDVDIIVSPISLQSKDLYSSKDTAIQEYAGLYYHSVIAAKLCTQSCRDGETIEVKGDLRSYFNSVLFYLYDEEVLRCKAIYRPLEEISRFTTGKSVLVPLDYSWLKKPAKDSVQDIEMGLWMIGDLLEKFTNIYLLCLQSAFFEVLSVSRFCKFKIH